MNTAFFTFAAVCLLGVIPAHAKTGFPDSFNASVSGASIGQSAEDFKAIIGALFPVNITDAVSDFDSATRGGIYQEGAKIEENEYQNPLDGRSFPASMSADYVHVFIKGGQFPNVSAGNQMSAVFASKSGNNHVQALSRTLSFDPPLNPDAALKKVIETYGEPHVTYQNAYFYYGFKDGEPIPDVGGKKAYEDLIFTCGLPKNSPRGIHQRPESAIIVPNTQESYLFGPPSFDKSDIVKDCDASARINVVMNKDGLVYMMNFLFVDLLDMKDDQALFLVDAEASAAKKAADAPTGTTKVPDF